MPVPYDEVMAISSEVVGRYPRQPPLEFVAVMPSDGESGRVEVMVTISGCHKEPCRLILNLSRHDRTGLADELRHKLQRALQSHLDHPGS
jgi:hypothetical protein